MPIQPKGMETKQKLLECSRELFYENGYHDTTTRLISSRANANLGLFHYYFKGKIEIGATVYNDIRDTFDDLIVKYEPSFNEVDLFLFSSALELYLCLVYPSFGKFFVEITEEPQIHERTINFIIHTFEKYSHVSDSKNYARLAGISISAVKPSIVRYSLNNPGVIANEEYIHYYLQQQLHFFGMDESLSNKYLRLLSKYHIALDQRLTPIFEPVEHL